MNGNAVTLSPNHDPVTAPTTNGTQHAYREHDEKFAQDGIKLMPDQKVTEYSLSSRPYPASPKHIPRNRKKNGAIRDVGSVPRKWAFRTSG